MSIYLALFKRTTGGESGFFINLLPPHSYEVLMNQLTTPIIVQITFEFAFAIVCLGEAIFYYLTKEKKKSATDMIVMILVVQFVNLISDCGAYVFRGRTEPINLLMTRVCNYLVFFTEATQLVQINEFTMAMIKERYPLKQNPILWVVRWVPAMEFVWLTLNLLTGWMYWFDEKNLYHRNWGWYVWMFSLLLLILINIVVIVYHWNHMDQAMGCLLLLGEITIIAGSLLQAIFYGYSLVVFIITFYAIVMYNLFAYRERIAAKKREKLLNQSRSGLLLAQIRPHFIQNCLSNIRGLCFEDVDKAADLIDDLSGYLRDTFLFMDADECIPLEKELELVDYYLKIEKTRFADKIQVHKELLATDFELPPLTLQPMVENAVRHGIRGKEGEGNLTIRTYEQNGMFVLEIEDDGVGFDMQKMGIHSGDIISAHWHHLEGHVGIMNVAERLDRMVGGSLEIDSRVGSGTLVTIRIPSKDRDRNMIKDSKR